MPLMAVKVTEEVWLTCLSHSLTTETEEIMGLLFGDIQHVNSRGAIALIWGASPQVRYDRRMDRVEVKPEQLAAASAQAEKMTLTTGRTTRVIGWYHSHPHITVLPSHVDVRTQAMYQQLDPGFIGLIFSCFSEDAQKVGRIQVIAFQSLDGKQWNATTVVNSSLVEVESSWSSSDMSASGFAYIDNIEDTCDSRMAKPKKIKKENSLVPYNADNLNNNGLDVDSMDMTASMQEALHRSNMDMSGAKYVRKEVPLQVLPSKALLKLDHPMSSFVDMQHVLFEEERSAYSQAISQNMHDGKIHPLTYIHHTSTYQASLCKLMEYCLNPAINALQAHLKENEIRLVQLIEEAKSLELEALGSRDREMNMNSHRHLLSHARDGNPSMDSSGARSPTGSSGTRSWRKAS